MNSKRVVLLLFSLLVSTFPFGAHLFSFSIGFMTLFPFLILLLLLSVLGCYHSAKSFDVHSVEKKYLWFLLVFFLVSLSYLPFVDSIHEAKIDVRSVLLMLLTGFVFIWTKSFVGFDVWRNRLSFLLKIIYVLILFVALLELKTGIHIQGYFTEKIDELHLASFIYTPVFLYDNPNNLTVYVSLIGLSILLVEGFNKKNILLAVLITVCNFLVSRLCSSRFGEVGVFLILFWLILNLVIEQKVHLKKRKNRFEMIWIGVVFSLALITFTVSPKYYSPIWSNENANFIGEDGFNEAQIDSLSIVSNGDEKLKGFLIENKDIHDTIRPFVDKKFSSARIRASLFYNGLEYLKESSLLGVGPGQFRYKHAKGEKKYYTKTNIGPHFWLLELASQYGVGIFFVYVLGIILLMYSQLKILKKNVYLVSLILFSFPIFIVMSMLPSSFLIYEINWIFGALLIILVSEALKLKKQLDG